MTNLLKERPINKEELVKGRAEFTDVETIRENKKPAETQKKTKEQEKTDIDLDGSLKIYHLKNRINSLRKEKILD